MNDIRPIETRYKGYRFRSRLEARWAVFFDALGFRWEYEPEGFVLPSGTKYLPDFKIDALRLWVEIKPQLESDAQWPDEAKFWEFAESLQDGFRAVLLAGLPGPDSYQGFVCGDNNYLWCQCSHCEALGIQYE